LLLGFFTHATQEGFLRHEHRQNLIVDGHVASLISKMSQFQPVAIDKWITDIKEETKKAGETS
jgi:hypothetical protein